MRNKDQNQRSHASLRKLSLSIGDFIRYWGFRRIHGAVWTQLYLSQTPLSCTELARRLRLSKALVSPALDELCGYKLIYETDSPNNKTKMYAAEDDINAVIHHVLKTREGKMMNVIASDFTSFKKAAERMEEINPSRLSSLEEMIFSASLMLKIMLEHKDVLQLPQEIA